MEIILVTPENYSHFEAIMTDVFKLRHRIFNGLLKWNLPHDNGLEYDCYDERALHLVGIEDDGTVVACWRLLPTTDTYMAEEVFPQFFEETGPISCPETWEVSRWAIDGDYYGNKKIRIGRIGAALVAALMEFCTLFGVAEILSVQNKVITRMANHYMGQPAWKSITIDAGACDATCYSYTPSIDRLFALRTQFHLPSPVISQYQISAFKLAA